MNTQEIDLNDLGLIDDNEQPIDLDNMPAERSSIPRELPTPGATLVFTLPAITSTNLKSIVQPLATQDGQRIQLVFRDENALKLGSGQHFDQTFWGRDQPVRKDGQVVGTTNEVAKLLKACGFGGTLTSKADYVKAILASSGASFKVDNSPKPYCNPKKGIFKDGKKVESILGCGKGYGLKAESFTGKNGKLYETFQIPRDAAGGYKTSFACACGAVLNAWPRYENFRTV